MTPLNEYYTWNDNKQTILNDSINQNDFKWLWMWRINRLCFGVFGSYKRQCDKTMSIKTGIKNYSITDSFILGIRNELPWRMRTIRALIQNIREKNRIYREIPNLFSGNKSYKRFQMTKITGSIFSMTYKKIENISCTSIALLNGVNCKVSTTAHEDLHNARRHQAGKDWIGTLKIIGVENTEVQ